MKITQLIQVIHSAPSKMRITVMISSIISTFTGHRLASRRSPCKPSGRSQQRRSNYPDALGY